MAVKLTNKQLGALKEIGTIGSGNAALALSQLVSAKVSMAVVKVDVLSSDEFYEIMGGPDVLGAHVYLRILGEFQGIMSLFFKREDSLRLIDLLLHQKKGSTIMLSEAGISALKEAGNILAGSYLNAMSQIAPFKIVLSVPKFAFDYAAAAVGGILGEFGRSSVADMALVTEFIESSSQVKGFFAFLPNGPALEKILAKL